MFNSKKPHHDDLPSSSQLIKSTIIAFITAAIILLVVVLPAEYGVDPTGIGNAIGLLDMGKIKVSLEKEITDEKKSTEMPKDKKLKKSVKADFQVRNEPIEKKSKEIKPELKTEVFEYSLKPGEGIEVKLFMNKGQKVNYKWVCENGLLNHDTHGDGPGRKSISFKKGRFVSSDEGELVAPFDGRHGWFWRNRDKKNVKVTLKVSGDFLKMKRVK